MIKQGFMNDEVDSTARAGSESPRGAGNPNRILLIEDDPQIAQLVTSELSDGGWNLRWAADGASGLAFYGERPPDLIVLDLNLPDIDGLTVCERIRVHDRLTPILMLTARATKTDIVRGLELGADEYLTKPFNSLELMARIRALLRRIAAYQTACPTPAAAEQIRRGSLVMDAVRRSTHMAAKPILLTAKEFDLLLLFVKYPGRTFTRDELLTRVWGDGFEGFEHTVNTHINRLRSKVEVNPKKPALIETVWGVGYRFNLQFSA